MKPLSITVVRQHTGIRNMPMIQAVKLVNVGPFVRAQAIALSLMTWNNTAEDWLRLQACLTILRHPQAARETAQTLRTKRR